MTVTGPLYRVTSSPTYEKRQTWYRQTPPYKERLPYDMAVLQLLGGSDNWNSWAEFPLTFNGLADQAYLKAYEKFVSEMSSSAQLANTFHERNQSFLMIADRLHSLARFASSLRKGRLGDAAKALNLSKPPKTASGFGKSGKAFGDAFLEWHFGWAPLLGEIHSLVDFLQDPVPKVNIKTRATVTGGQVYRTAPPYWTEYDYTCTARAQLVADISINNPNLYLANRLGLLNPASIAWEAVPFSFVVDWFVPVSTFLNSFTDFAGVDLHSPATTYYVELRRTTSAYFGYVGTSRSVIVNRQSGFHRPILVTNRLSRLSVSRAATAASLLFQRLK